MKNNIHPIHNHWVETVSGSVVDLLNPREETICIRDIAWSLSRQARHNGATTLPMPYTVADHSIWVAEYLYTLTADPSIALYGLLHDAHEAYTGDIITPVKNLPGVRDAIVKVQTALQRAILSALNLPDRIPELVVYADCTALSIEVLTMMHSYGSHWRLQNLEEIQQQVDEPVCRLPLQGYQVFMDKFTEYQSLTTACNSTPAA